MVIATLNSDFFLASASLYLIIWTHLELRKKGQNYEIIFFCIQWWKRDEWDGWVKEACNSNHWPWCAQDITYIVSMEGVHFSGVFVKLQEKRKRDIYLHLMTLYIAIGRISAQSIDYYEHWLRVFLLTLAGLGMREWGNGVKLCWCVCWCVCWCWWNSVRR